MFLPRRRLVQFAIALLVACVASAKPQGGEAPRVEAIRFWSFGDITRVAIETEGEYQLASDQIENPARVYFDLIGLKPPANMHKGMATIAVGDPRVRQIRVAEVMPGKTRIVFDLEGPVEVVSSQLVNPDRLMIEIRPKGTSLPALTRSVTGSQRINLSLPPAETVKDPPAAPSGLKPSAAKVLSSLESPQAEPTKAQLDVGSTGEPPPTNPDAKISVPVKVDLPAPPPPIEVASREPLPAATGRRSKPPQDAGVAAAKADSSGDRSLVRVLGLKLGRVMIDAGHGGKDTGTIGPNGLMEKELVLDVALRLGKLIKKELGAEVVYTRSDDTFIPLEQRTLIANREKADLFISVHANASPEPTATGVETYYFNLNADKSGLDLAMRENASAASSISDLNDLLHRAVLQTKLEESRDFAQKVQESLLVNAERMNSRAHDRGVRRAPFVVLIGATMPSILAEIGFVSNPHDEKLMKRNEQRERIAEALFKGVTQYANSLSHTQMARVGSE